MTTRYITKGKGRKRRVIPINNKKKSVRSVSLEPKAVLKINKEQAKLLNKGEPANFSKALNTVVLRAKRDGIPVYHTRVNINDRMKPYHMFVTDMKKHKKVKGSDTIVIADSYGQAVDDFITVWNKENRMKMTIGYPVVQGTADKSFRYARDSPKFERSRDSEGGAVKYFAFGSDGSMASLVDGDIEGEMEIRISTPDDRFEVRGHKSIMEKMSYNDFLDQVKKHIERHESFSKPEKRVGRIT